MNSNMHLVIVTSLSMVMTFALHCVLKDTRANGFLLQNTFIDVLHDRLLHLRCLFNKQKINQEACEYIIGSDMYNNTNLLISIIILLKTLEFLFGRNKAVYYTLSILYTIFGGWFVGRLYDGFDLWHPLDMFTVYFLIWQFMFVITQWKFEQLPLVSTTLYRGWLCLLMASQAFIVHDFIFRYLPSPAEFCFFWIFSVKDIFDCLHPNGYLNDTITIDEVPSDDSLQLSSDDFPALPQIYYTFDFVNNEPGKKDTYAYMGLADFFMFNLMLLTILPCLSSMTTKVCVTIGHIIAVQIGQHITIQLGYLYNRSTQPALPLSVIVFSIYAVLLNCFIEY